MFRAPCDRSLNTVRQKAHMALLVRIRSSADKVCVSNDDSQRHPSQAVDAVVAYSGVCEQPRSGNGSVECFVETIPAQEQQRSLA